ncbi:hypothetical protein M8C21_032145 [Ambrosia artemisiifolia]|uniref:Uncharacterized protein n=1 Tax=Ambrosia artemisiifolia TaxID=4212 RepID=A0AAD5C9M6_AMBAR|nr:hypothetical protein M8C21_032145 [Ambrosia artemisiifolia]
MFASVPSMFHKEVLREEHERVDEKEKEEEDENEGHEFSFTFKFPTFEEFSKNSKSFSEVLLEDYEADKPDMSLDGMLVSNECPLLEFEGSVHESHDDQECAIEHLVDNSSNSKSSCEDKGKKRNL